MSVQCASQAAIIELLKWRLHWARVVTGGLLLCFHVLGCEDVAMHIPWGFWADEHHQSEVSDEWSDGNTIFDSFNRGNFEIASYFSSIMFLALLTKSEFVGKEGILT
jgi:hypothetical protein